MARPSRRVQTPPARECTASDGTGLQGLRERLEGAGGRLDAGPGAGGGYRVIATVPIAAGNGESA